MVGSVGAFSGWDPCLQALEEKLGKPLITDTLAMVWYSLRLAGIKVLCAHDDTLMLLQLALVRLQEPVAGVGTLLRNCLEIA